jgi:signal transduction histidine kinase
MEEETFFASAQRTSFNIIKEEQELITSQNFLNELFGAIDGVAAIINKNRQVVFANDNLLKTLGLGSLDPVLGKRPGEVVSCVNSAVEPSGCGTSLACRYCGAVNAILESSRTRNKTMRETRITSSINGQIKSWDLNVTSTPISINGQDFFILMLADISDEKRRMAIERIFFHDILNSAGGLNGILNILKEETNPAEVRNLIFMSEELSRELVEEILLHRRIRTAENGDLQVKAEKLNSMDFLNATVEKIRFHEIAHKKKIIISGSSVGIEFESDRILLQRIIINMIKNALEAIKDGGIVQVGTEVSENRIKFWVKNEGEIPLDVQSQMFQRSFTTKGKGRGIGTYSIRLLTENYLKGKVNFTSNKQDGTIFFVSINKIWPND